jgi:hypothetical protein
MDALLSALGRADVERQAIGGTRTDVHLDVLVGNC